MDDNQEQETFLVVQKRKLPAYVYKERLPLYGASFLKHLLLKFSVRLNNFTLLLAFAFDATNRSSSVSIWAEEDKTINDQ